MSGYIGNIPTPQATQTRDTFTATAGQTTFATSGYTPSFLDVFMNGVKLVSGSDFTASNGSDVVLTSGAAAGDTLEVVAYSTFQLANQSFTGDFSVDSPTFVVDSTNNRVGIGTTSPAQLLEVEGSAITGDGIRVGTSSNDGSAASQIAIQTNNADRAAFIGGRQASTGGYLAVQTKAVGGNLEERMRIDSSGNLLVSTTAATVPSDGAVIATAGGLSHSFGKNGKAAVILNRSTSGGDIAVFRYNNSTVGNIGTDTNDLYVASANTHSAGLLFNGAGALGNQDIRPCNSSGAGLDNVIDLGDSAYRFDDIYATNGTIQTSDQNEKQQIATLTDAEITAAKAISKLFKTFKWNDSVAEKGDTARTHTGVIAQEVEQAMTDAGLNAGDYAFFISTTWWETQTDVPAVEADEKNGIEAQEAYTRTDIYDTAEEAPEGATERNRKGIRYPQLLSFIGAATEQRLASIEDRLDALENPA